MTTNALMNRVRISIRTTLSSKYAPPAIQCHSTVKASATNQSHGLSGNKSSREEYMREWKFQRTKVPGPVHSRKQKFQGAKVPGSELTRIQLELSLQGSNWPGNEKARCKDILVKLHLLAVCDTLLLLVVLAYALHCYVAVHAFTVPTGVMHTIISGGIGKSNETNPNSNLKRKQRELWLILPQIVRYLFRIKGCLLVLFRWLV